MKQLGKQSCTCVQGYDINTGDVRGDNYTQQATPSERKRVWEIFKAIEDKSSEQWNATPRGDEGARARIRELAREQRHEETLKVVRHWQSIKQAKQQGSHSSAAAEVDTSAVQSSPTPQHAPAQATTAPQHPPLPHAHATRQTTWPGKGLCPGECLAKHIGDIINA
jgi:hypothetical protein